ncbi:hypothetical protein HNV11_20960 [Spirosoma taeanense]|uniref:Uncharacterized protein n=1 Tax=Spirosoma taeanense TaxID=2735870 RepID=A0A6M5YEF8_9BACT|nr:hypothetical protein [Spirosoma taeanense]QJW91673.1 hypothetical protein HNV11_20960 [Spirosoma taeanense]
MNILRNGLVLSAFALTSLDFFHHFVLLSQGWFFLGQLLFLLVGLAVATMCGALTAHALLSLWRGTPFVKDLIDHEPEPVLVN